MVDRRSRDTVQAVERAFAVIGALGGRDEHLTLADIADRTSLPRGTARRMLITLAGMGYVRQEDRFFYLQPRILDLCAAYLSSNTLWDVARSHLERLVERVRETGSASVLDGTDIIFTVRVRTKRIMSVQVEVGTRMVAYATSMGRVLLAGLAPAELDDYFTRVRPEPITPKTVDKEPELRDIIRRVAEQGWCLLDEELEIGVRSLAVPVHDAAGKVIAAVNVCAPTGRVSAERMVEEFLPVLRETSVVITRDNRSRP
jgi:IclR family pca regulon transcriptional regulator